MSGRGPMRGSTRLATEAPTMIPAEKGRKANPVLRAEYCSVPWKK